MSSDNSQSLNIQLARFRAAALKQLITLTSLPADECRETYLFENECFCGVRWTLGGARAVWRSGTDGITCEPSERPPQQSSDVRRAA